MDRHFETVYVVNPEIGEEAIKGITAKAVELVGKHGGEDVEIDEWGRRRLAYPIAKRNDGHYVVLSFSRGAAAGAGPLVEELELMFKHNEDVMRFQTVVLKKRAARPEEPEAAKPAEAAEAAKPDGGAENA